MTKADTEKSHWRELALIFRNTGIVADDFTGELRLNFRSGGISMIIRTEVVAKPGREQSRSAVKSL